MSLAATPGIELHSAKTRAVRLLRDLIEGGQVEEGERLPAESKLAKEFNVSRITLRSALSLLEKEGIVRRERNIGCIRVKKPGSTMELMSKTIVLLSDHRPAKDTRVFGGSSDAVVSGVMDAISTSDLNLFRVRSFDVGNRWLRELIAGHPAGVIVSIWNDENA